MSNLPPFRGAPGKPATFSGDNGMNRQGGEAEGRAKAFRNEGAKEGGPSSMPSEARAGAFACDESCQGYTGNSHDASGSNGRAAAPNAPMRVSLPRETAK